MEKFFYPDETYDKAIKNKDVGVLRALLTGIIGSDPTFATSEFDEAKKYIKDKSIELHGEELILTEDYKEQEDEVEKKIEGEWDEHYFQMNLVWLRDNFNLQSRFPKIERIGKVVYKDKLTLGKAKKESGGRTNPKKDYAVRTNKNGNYGQSCSAGGIDEWGKDHWLLLVVIVIAIFGLVFLGVKLIGKN